MSLRTRTLTLLAALGLVAALPVGLVAPAGAAGPLPTSTKVTSSASSLIVGTPVTLTAKVSVLNLGGLVVTPTGAVTFKTSTGGPATALGSAPLSAGTSCVLTTCTATLTTSALPVGTNTVTATYGGDLLATGSAGTTTVTVAPPPDTPPSAPTLTATSQVGSIQLHWTSASDGGQPITGYAIQRSTSATGPFATQASGLPTGDYQDTTVEIGTTYFYRATSTNSVGTSGFSNVASSAATSNGPGTFSTTACPAGSTCTSPTATFVDGPATTTMTVQTEASASPHTVTVAIGGPNLAGCSFPGVSGTFNDTSTDAFKTVVVRVTGQAAADAAFQAYAADTTFVGCLGLDHPWFRGSTSLSAVWVPGDGLYEGKPITCANNGAFFLGGTHFSQPCTSVFYQHLGNATDFFELTYNLPPGDGRISGGS